MKFIFSLLIFDIANIIYIFAKQASLVRRSTVLSLSLLLAFPGNQLYNNLYKIFQNIPPEMKFIFSLFCYFTCCRIGLKVSPGKSYERRRLNITNSLVPTILDQLICSLNIINFFPKTCYLLLSLIGF